MVGKKKSLRFNFSESLIIFILVKYRQNFDFGAKIHWKFGLNWIEIDFVNLKFVEY